MVFPILLFIFLSVLFFFGIGAYRRTAFKRKIQLIKLIGYSIICSSLSVVVITFIVMMF
jgi:hypothetical protein